MLNPVTIFRQWRAARSMEASFRSFAQQRAELNQDLSFTEATRRFPSRNDLYAYMHRYFFNYLPPELRQHREYFASRGRGFGEPAFHSMWYLLLREFRPSTLLEIGVYRGQVISLWALTAKNLQVPMEVHCISPFSETGDLVSKYKDLNYFDDVMANFRHFGLAPPSYVKALSTEPEAVAYLKSMPLDCVYIDGGHDYDVVLSDYRNSVAALKAGGLLVMDDASLYTDYEPPSFSFAGHPGPSKVARDLADREMEFLGSVGHQNIYRKHSS